MTGLARVRAHLDSFMARRVEDFERQLTSTYRYRFLPPVMGEGPAQARRWCDLLFSLYRDWAYSVEDEHDEGGIVALRVSFVGLDPVEPQHSLPAFYDSCFFQFELEGDLLAGCDALYLPFESQIALQTGDARHLA